MSIPNNRRVESGAITMADLPSNDFLSHVLNCMRSHISPSITQIAGNTNKNAGELIGSGTFLNFGPNLYLLTASHVTAKLYDQNFDGSSKYDYGLSCQIGYGNKMLALKDWLSWNKCTDLSVTRVNPVEIDGTDVIPLQSVMLAHNSNNLDDDYYFIMGWPGTLSRFIPFFDGSLCSKSLPYLGRLGSSKSPDFDEEYHFVITYPMDETSVVDEHGIRTTLPHPAGMSGSLVWKTNLLGTDQEWTPKMARVVGLAHQYDSEESGRCLIATRVEYLRGLLIYSMDAENWKSR